MVSVGRVIGFVLGTDAQVVGPPIENCGVRCRALASQMTGGLYSLFRRALRHPEVAFNAQVRIRAGRQYSWNALLTSLSAIRALIITSCCCALATASAFAA